MDAPIGGQTGPQFQGDLLDQQTGKETDAKMGTKVDTITGTNATGEERDEQLSEKMDDKTGNAKGNEQELKDETGPPPQVPVAVATVAAVAHTEPRQSGVLKQLSLGEVTDVRKG